MRADDFFEINDSWEFYDIFDISNSPVEWLKNISEAILQKVDGCSLRNDIPSGCHIGDNVFIHPTVKLPPVCVIEGPAYIGKNTTIRPFAYIRDNVIIGDNCLIGNSCEIKNSIVLNNAQIPHFNYVGDSVLGNFSHLGAGVILANLRLDKCPVVARFAGERIETKLRKLGAIVGDHSEVACNVVLNPGTILGKNSVVFGK